MPFTNDTKPTSVYSDDSLNLVAWADPRYVWSDSLISWGDSFPIFNQYTDDLEAVYYFNWDDLTGAWSSYSESWSELYGPIAYSNDVKPT